MSKLTAERLHEVLGYDPATGRFTRKDGPVVREVGTDNGYGYLRIWIDGKRYRAHRLAWFYVHGCWPTDQIDHRDGNRSNNALANLREATSAENARNSKPKAGNLKGAFWHKRYKKWHAAICRNRQVFSLGYFDTAEEAHAAYAVAAVELHGEFARVA